MLSVIGGPLPTGVRRAIDEVIRTTAPMHDGFAGGGFVESVSDTGSGHRRKDPSRAVRARQHGQEVKRTVEAPGAV